ncbi:MAG: TonB-dependent receptor [Bacteroidetes bacterium]|nr:TonB-dependent receptor [Bacteroidota bacterium]MBT6836338.1 TonB-dependent receptor [Bacteroidota bacterium]
MKTLSGILLAVLLPVLAFSQFNMKGKVIDAQSKQILIGASVIIQNTYSGMQTNQSGYFEFSDLKKGTYVLEFGYIGYNKFEKQVQLNKNEEFIIELQPSPIMQEEVIIQASKADENTPGTFQNLEKADIESINLGKDLPMLLDLTPSVVSTSDAGAGVGYTNLWIRGTDMQRINVTINGIPFNDAESHSVYFVDLPDLASSTNSIQIQRGVGTSTNGAAAFGASINIQTNGIRDKAYADLNNSFGSFNTRKHSLSAGTGLINNKWSFDARLSKISSDGYIDRATSDLQSYHVSGAWYGKNSLLKINIMSGLEETYQAWYGVPKDLLETNRTFNPYTYENEVDHYQQDHYQIHYSGTIGKTLSYNTALHYTRGYGYYEQYKNDRDFDKYGLETIQLNDTLMKIGNENYIFPDSTIYSTDLIQRKWLDNHFYGLLASIKYDNHKKLNAILSTGWNRYDGDHYGNIIWAQFASNGAKDHQWYFNSGLKTDFNVFAKANYQLTNKLFLYGDIQLRSIHYSIEGNHDDLRDLGMEKQYVFLNPKAGFLYKYNAKHQSYFAFAVANREPNRSNFRDADVGQLPLAEKLTDFELGHKYHNNKLQFEANAYFMNYMNQLVLTGEINNVGDPIMTNVDQSYRAGLEFVSNIKFNKKLSWTANLTLSQNRIIDFKEYVDNWSYWDDPANELFQYEKELGTTDIAFSPNIIASSIFNYKPIKGLSLGLQTKYVGKQFIDNTSNDERSLDAYVINNVLISYELPLKSVKKVQFQLHLNNILNEKYESNAWVYRYYYGGDHYEDYGYFPQAGFNFLTGVNISF